jgi:hypothetical protein
VRGVIGFAQSNPLSDAIRSEKNSPRLAAFARQLNVSRVRVFPDVLSRENQVLAEQHSLACSIRADNRSELPLKRGRLGRRDFDASEPYRRVTNFQDFFQVPTIPSALGPKQRLHAWIPRQMVIGNGFGELVPGQVTVFIGPQKPRAVGEMHGVRCKWPGFS